MCCPSLVFKHPCFKGHILKSICKPTSANKIQNRPVFYNIQNNDLVDAFCKLPENRVKTPKTFTKFNKNVYFLSYGDCLYL